MLGDERLIEIMNGGLRCKRPTEVYSRVCGFFRPVQAWNLGKKSEYKERVVFKATLLTLALLLPAPAEVVRGAWWGGRGDPGGWQVCQLLGAPGGGYPLLPVAGRSVDRDGWGLPG